MGVCAGQKKPADLKSWLHLNLLWASSGQLRPALPAKMGEQWLMENGMKRKTWNQFG